jgi:hypothetical protein
MDFKFLGFKGSVTPGVTLICSGKFRVDIWKQQGPLYATLHGVISQNAVLFIVRCVSSSHLT